MTGKRKRIIMLDDSVTNLNIGKDILKDRYEVFPVTTKDKLSELLSNFIPDLILLDVDMPDTDGYEVARFLKADAVYRDIPIIFLTSMSDPQSEMAGLSLGALDYIHRPFVSELLIRRLESHLSLVDHQKELKNKNESLERYVELMLANCPDPILLFDREGRLAYASDSYIEHSGIGGAERAIGKTIRQLFKPAVSADILNSLEGMFQLAVDDGVTETAEWEIDLNRDGQARNYRVLITPMLDPMGDKGGVLTLLHDMTDIIRALQETRRARDFAERSLRARADFLARMSHEMRTPMNAIMGMSTIYSATNDAQRKDYCAQRISEASKHMTALVDDILEMSNIEADSFRLIYRKCDIENTVRRLAASVSYMLSANKQQFSVDIGADVPKAVVTDGMRLSGVLSKLMSNAMKFTPEGGEISLSVELLSESGGEAVLRFTVSDTGIGIPVEKLERLFEPFEQLDGGTSRKYGGSGLGLAIAYRTVRNMGGELEVRSEDGHGSTFSFTIPVSKAAVSPTRVDLGGGSIKGIFAGFCILLVEDVGINREIICAMLEDTGVEIVQALNGLDALEKFAAAPGRFDLVLMDIHMPNMDGYESTQRIRASGMPGADTIPIIALTANMFPEDVQRCLDCGMNYHLGKPADIDEIIATLSEYLF